METENLLDAARGEPIGERLPVLFLGHGSPMNGIEDNEFSAAWKALGREIPRPKAVLFISAHWLTRGTAVTAMERPRTIHDFGGFPKALFDVRYPAPGNPALARDIASALGGNVGLDRDWGLDHGAWTIARHMYPDADVPVLQLSIDYPRPAQWHYDLGRLLRGLRRRGVLIAGSGNMVHNLRMGAFDRMDDPAGYGYDWAHEMNAVFKSRMASGDHAGLVAWEKLGPAARLAIPTPDHYYPLLYVLGAMEEGENPVFFNDKAVGGSFTMTSVRAG